MSIFNPSHRTMWLRFVKDYTDVDTGKVKYATGWCGPVDWNEGQCLIECSYAVPYTRQEVKGKDTNATGATG
jgi:hypothetical protein